MIPNTLTIAGVDPSGGAGILADVGWIDKRELSLKTATQFRVLTYACSYIQQRINYGITRDVYRLGINTLTQQMRL